MRIAALCLLAAAKHAGAFVLTLPVLYDVRGKLFPNNKYGTMATEDMVDAVYGNSSDGSGVYGGVANVDRQEAAEQSGVRPLGWRGRV